MVTAMRVTLLIARCMERAFINTLMERFTEGIGLRVSGLVKASKPILMETDMMENSLMASVMEKVFIVTLVEAHIVEIGFMEKEPGMVFSHTQTVISMKEIFVIARCMERHLYL